MKILPETKLGKWALGLFLSFFPLGYLGSYVSEVTGNTIEYPNPVNSPLLGSIIYLTFAVVIAAAIIGLIAVIQKKDRSLLVFLSIPFGVFFLFGVVMFLVGALIGPPK